MKFKCDGFSKRWKLKTASCVEPEPPCKATKYKIGIEGEKLRFSLPAGEGKLTESCNPLKGSVSFECDNKTRRWKVSDVGCMPVIICKAAKYHIQIGDAMKLNITLPSSREAEKTIDKQCSDGLTGTLTFKCIKEAKHWRLIHSGCIKSNNEQGLVSR